MNEDEKIPSEDELAEAFATVIKFLFGLGYTAQQLLEMGPEESHRIACAEYALLM